MSTALERNRVSPRARTVRISPPHHDRDENAATTALDRSERMMVRRAASAAYEAQRRPFAAHWDDLGPVEQDRWLVVARTVMRVMAHDLVGGVRALEGDHR